MGITITAFRSSPDKGAGLARDTPVRWALEEVRQPYDVRLITFTELKAPDHVAMHPFGQIPTYEDGTGLVLFESGAIVLHLAQQYPGLLPPEGNDDGGGAAQARARAVGWVFAALSTVEPPIVERSQARISEASESWYEDRLPLLDSRIRVRLASLARWLGDREWLDGAFSAGDLMMVSVLRRVQHEMLGQFPNLVAYVARGKARPAFQRAFEAQLEVFQAASARTE